MSLELPQADARVSGRSSVALVICQVRFDEQPSIDPAAAIEFHERLGGEAGPYSKIESVAGGGRILLQLGPSGPIQQQPTRETGWSLEQEDGSWSLTLLPDSISLQVNEGSGAYEGWDDFRDRFAAALTALEEVASPAFEHRLGLRVVDRLPGAPLGVADAKGWTDYISPNFLGPVAETTIAESAKFAQHQLILDAGGGMTCNVRQGLAAVLSPEEPNTEYVIDTDVYRERGRPFDAVTILDGAGAFKQTIDDVFGAVTTTALLDKLAP